MLDMHPTAEQILYERSHCEQILKYTMCCIRIIIVYTYYYIVYHYIVYILGVIVLKGTVHYQNHQRIAQIYGRWGH